MLVEIGSGVTDLGEVRVGLGVNDVDLTLSQQDNESDLKTQIDKILDGIV